MTIVRQHWWKVLIIVLAGLAARILTLQLLPLSPTFELPLSALSQTIGMIPTAMLVITAAYLVIVVVLLNTATSSSTLSRIVSSALAYGIFWFVAVLESVPALSKPLLPELLVGLADIVPVLLLGTLVSVWTAPGTHLHSSRSLPRRMANGVIVAAIYIVGRYFLYTIIRVNSGYLSGPEATFWWTLAMGLAVGLMYTLLQEGIKGAAAWQRGLFFGVVIYGLIWALSNFFMPIMFNMSFINFDPPILNYVWRVTIDVLFVSAGVWLAEWITMNEQP